jgi:hypothetical protein
LLPAFDSFLACLHLPPELEAFELFVQEIHMPIQLPILKLLEAWQVIGIGHVEFFHYATDTVHHARSSLI